MNMPELGGNWLARAAGGHKIHLLPKGSKGALCGHEPRRTPGSMKTYKGDWYHVQGDVTEPTCKKCKEAA